MKYVLRPKQLEAADLAVAFFEDKRKRNGLMVEPTAFGKSLLIAEIAHRLGGGLVVFQPSRELLMQNQAKLEAYGVSPGVWSASMGRKDLGDIVLATIGSVKGCPEIFDEYPYVIVDEGHGINSKEGMYKDFFTALGDVKILAMTATPWRLHASGMGTQAKFLTRTRPKIIDEVTHYTQISEMVQSDYWARLEYWPIKGFKPSKLPLNSTGAEYDKEQLQMHLWESHWQTKTKKAVHFPDKLTEMVNRLLDAGRKHILVFTSFTRESEYLGKQMRGACAVVTAKTPDAERDSTLQDFKTGEIPVVANVGILGTGFDFPQLDTIILARPTRSLALNYQQIGRGVRVHPNKSSCYIVDMVESTNTFGRVEDLTLYCEGQSKWGMFGRPGGGKEVALTNVWLGGNPGCCPKCLAPRFFAVYEKSGKMVPLSAPPAGYQANIVVKQEGSKKVCEMVERGDPSAEFCFHFLICDRLRRLREK